MENKQFSDILATVPGSFKAKLERIRRYLHLGKASVMVGAGFSRNADVPTHIKVKQWNDVGEDIYCRLQAVDKAEPKELVFKTPMRLASEFAAVNGRSELDNLIRDAIPDDKMTPGALHRQLLELPWRDVLPPTMIPCWNAHVEVCNVIIRSLHPRRCFFTRKVPALLSYMAVFLTRHPF